MATKRLLRKKSCGNKIRYDTKQDAILAGVKVKYKTRDTSYIDGYYCKFCKHYHWGHK